MTPDSRQSESFNDADIVGRAAVSLRDMDVPQGPSVRLVAETRAAMDRARAPSRTKWSLLIHQPLLRLAAVVAIVCGTAIIAYRIAHRATTVPSGPGDELVKVRPVAPGSGTPAPIPSHVEPPAPSIVHNHNPPSVPMPTPTPTPAPVVASAGGIITGRVWFDGPHPPRVPLLIADSMPECKKLHGGPIMDESFVVNANGGLANVVVSVSEGLSGWLPEEFPPPAAPALLDQKGCVFSPHVVAVMVGQPLIVKNSDPMAHNVRIMAVNNPPANLGQPFDSETETEKFSSPEVFRVKCDMHPWMEAWVRVVDNPFFAITGPDGRFYLQGLPPGTYTLKAWHEQLGVREMQIKISPGRGATVDFTFRR